MRTRRGLALEQRAEKSGVAWERRLPDGFTLEREASSQMLLSAASPEWFEAGRRPALPVSLLPPAQLHMHLGGLAHVVIHLVIDGGLEHVVIGFGHVANRLEVEAEVEVGVA